MLLLVELRAMEKSAERTAFEQSKTHFGTVKKVNEDGTVDIELNLENPEALTAFAHSLAFGVDAANVYLKRGQN